MVIRVKEVILQGKYCLRDKAKHMKYILLALITTTSLVSFGQSNFNTQRNWSRNKKEIIIGLGATNFLGDLGGANQIGTDYSLKDLDFPSTSIGGSLAYRYRFHPYYATTTILNIGLVRGSDAKTTEQYRNLRNLSFRSAFINLTQRIEIIALAREKVGRRFNIPGLRGFKDKNDQLYLFTGIGVAFSNPKAQYQGSYVALRPLKTEGQGLAGGADPYSRFTATIPLGVGFRIGINQEWRIGIEVTYVKTFSDYIDDVSGVYYDSDILLAQVGPESAALSNPSKVPSSFNPGSQRGDKQKDALLYANLTVIRNITNKSYGKKQPRIRFQKYRAKF